MIIYQANIFYGGRNLKPYERGGGAAVGWMVKKAQEGHCRLAGQKSACSVQAVGRLVKKALVVEATEKHAFKIGN